MGKYMGDFEQELEELLAEGVEGARQREAAAFDELADLNTNDIVLFGAGNLGRHTLESLRKIAIEPRCFVDNNEALWDKELSGIPVLNPVEGAKLYGRTSTFVVTIWFGEASRDDVVSCGSITAKTRMQARCAIPPILLEVF